MSQVHDVELALPHREITFDQTYQHHREMPVAWVYAHPLFDIGVESIALVQKQSHYERPLKTLRGHMFMVMLQGGLAVQSGSTKMEVDTGMICFCPSGDPMARLCKGESAWWVEVFLLDWQTWEPLKRNGPYVRPYGYVPQLASLTSSILQARWQQTAESRMVAQEDSRFLVDLIMRELRTAETVRGGKHVEALQELVTRIHLHPEDDWTLPAMAEAVGVSKRTLGRLFVQRFGVSPMELVIKNRVDKAVELLMTTNLTIKDIAGRLNYANVSSFSELFLTYTGMRPGEYRKTRRSGGAGPLAGEPSGVDFRSGKGYINR